jgi:hypothetical protein
VALGAATMLPYAAPFAAKANKVLSSDWEQVRNWGCCSECACMLLLYARCRASSSTLSLLAKVGCSCFTCVYMNT